MPKTLTLKLLKKSGKMAVNLTKNLSWKKTGERWLHGVVLGLLEASVGNMRSEYPVEESGRVTKPKCIDLRHGGNNPDVIELVVRVHGGELYGSQNRSELLKLCKIPYEKARHRMLLLLDPSGRPPIPKNILRKSYLNLGGGRGRFPREQVTIVYIHPKAEYAFRWKP